MRELVEKDGRNSRDISDHVFAVEMTEADCELLNEYKTHGRRPVREMNLQLRILTQFIGFIRDLLGWAAKRG